ncbi:hypothetical protein BOX15_Mlig018716g1 [Macrostomum lignano]|uniref:Uncharacterized protein n=1 Tax=Macrostomum lignano TaxID=282301 RepID=A0A267F6P6_9PLAT|nr:hypothetical protein BOX15_Mlig018716g2 [Macrostomum lignano]PAA68827.1 hypothetical protein BOX15_Mlig018716g1 [Macrostomum lignano]
MQQPRCRVSSIGHKSAFGQPNSASLANFAAATASATVVKQMTARGENSSADTAGGEGEPSPKWQLRYWPNVPGRAEFIRLILVEAGQEFSEHCDPEAIYLDFKCQQKTGWPVFAVPMIKQGDFELGQTATICRYLAKRLGLLPDGEPDRWRADQTCATVMDFITEGRLAFHGRNFYESYFGQEAETRPYIDYFERHRLPKFLRHFEQVLSFNAANWDASGGGRFVVGRRVTYCDLCLLHVLRAAESQFPAAWARSIGDCPRLAEFKAGMEDRPRVRDYLSSARCKPFEGNSMM